jgi:hypothetical protein
MMDSAWFASCFARQDYGSNILLRPMAKHEKFFCAIIRAVDRRRPVARPHESRPYNLESRIHTQCLDVLLFEASIAHDYFERQIVALDKLLLAIHDVSVRIYHEEVS